MTVFPKSRLFPQPASRGPSDEKVRMRINMQQEGEIAFQLHSLAQLQLIGGSVLLESQTYEA